MPSIIVNADFSQVGLGKVPTLEQFYQQETKDIIDANLFESLNTNTNKAIYKEAFNNLIRKLKTDGVWAKMDFIFIPWLSQSKSEAQINLKTGLTVSDMYYQQDTYSEVNFGLRHKENTSNTDGAARAGIQLPYSWNYDYEDFHVALYHNDLNNASGNVIVRNNQIQPNQSLIDTRYFYNLAVGSSFSSRLGFSNDANRKTLTGFDNNFIPQKNKLLALSTYNKAGVITARTSITGNDNAGEFAEVDVTNYFPGTELGHIQLLGGTDNNNLYRCNGGVISLGRGLNAQDLANYRKACDEMGVELLGTIPTFTLY